MPLDPVEFATARLTEDVSRTTDARTAARLKTLRKLIGEESPLCACNEADDPPTDPDDGSHRLPHHYDCPAYEISLMLAQVDNNHPEFSTEWWPPHWASEL